MRDPGQILSDMLKRVDARIALRPQKMRSDRSVSLEATGKPDLIRDMRRGVMPSVDKAIGLAAALGCRLEWLLTGEGSETTPASLIEGVESLVLDIEADLADRGISLYRPGKSRAELLSRFGDTASDSGRGSGKE